MFLALVVPRGTAFSSAATPPKHGHLMPFGRCETCTPTAA